MLNNFAFNRKNYLEIKGCAPAYANIFKNHFEREIYLPFIERLSLSCLSFIDDIFLICIVSKDQLITFLNDLNTKHNSIKFEYKISQSSMPFLDTEVYIKNNKLYIKVYRKETSRQNILYINPEQPISLTNITPYSQL